MRAWLTTRRAALPGRCLNGRCVLAFLMVLVFGVVGRAASAASSDESDEIRSGGRPLTLDVPRTFAMEPAMLRALVRVERDAENRKLRLIIDSGSFYSSSDIQLNGADAPRHHQLTLRALPAGQYCIEAVLFRASGGTQTVRHPYTVIGSGEALEDTRHEACSAPALGPIDGEERPNVPDIALDSSLR